MKIVRNTPEQLILRSSSWLWGVFLGALILVSCWVAMRCFVTGDRELGFFAAATAAFTGLSFATFVQRDDLILDRSCNLLELRHSTVSGRKKVQHDLSDLQTATIQTNISSKGANTHRVVLILDGGPEAGVHPVTAVYRNGNGAALAAEAINGWLSAT